MPQLAWHCVADLSTNNRLIENMTLFRCSLKDVLLAFQPQIDDGLRILGSNVLLSHNSSIRFSLKNARHQEPLRHSYRGCSGFESDIGFKSLVAKCVLIPPSRRSRAACQIRQLLYYFVVMHLIVPKKCLKISFRNRHSSVLDAHEF